MTVVGQFLLRCEHRAFTTKDTRYHEGFISEPPNSKPFGD